MSKLLRVWTDGACFPNPGRGGWAWVTQDKKFSSGYEERSTNNRMEIMAVIKAIEPYRGRQIEIITDSKFVIQSTLEWRKGWEQRGWMTKGDTAVKNRDLWEELFSLVDLNLIRFTWVKGHSGVFMNELADRIALKASQNALVQSLDELMTDGKLINIESTGVPCYRMRFSSGHFRPKKSNRGSQPRT